MNKSLLPVLMLMLFVAGCASKPQTPPLPPSCPAPPRLPALPPPPSDLEKSFLYELETILFRSHSEQKKSGPTLKPADAGTKQPGLQMRP